MEWKSEGMETRGVRWRERRVGNGGGWGWDGRDFNVEIQRWFLVVLSGTVGGGCLNR